MIGVGEGIEEREVSNIIVERGGREGSRVLKKLLPKVLLRKRTRGEGGGGKEGTRVSDPGYEGITAGTHMNLLLYRAVYKIVYIHNIINMCVSEGVEERQVSRRGW